uniref:Wall-associated receptor kinase galacturonan-binding domain-containing protein n=1 Tax=Rhizophora mucronata TaxID=61149 RepID=A0A2P2MVW3_RHIMU
MLKEGRLPFASYTALLFLVLVFQSCDARKTRNANNCPTSSCGTINISPPFRLNTDPNNCGDVKYNLSCEDNSTVALYWGNSVNKKFYVQEIDYNGHTIRVVDAGVDKHDCSSVPRVPLDYHSYNDSYIYYHYRRYYMYHDYTPIVQRNSAIIFVKCENPVNSPLYLDRGACWRNGSSPAKSVDESSYHYAIIGDDFTVGELMDQCTIERKSLLLLPFKNSINKSCLEIHRQLAYGFQLKWCDVHCTRGCIIETPNYGSFCYLGS